MVTSIAPVHTPSATRQRASTGTEPANAGSTAAIARPTISHGRMLVPRRSSSRPVKSIAGSEPTATKRSASPSVPFDAPTASWTAGTSAAQPPQSSPNPTKAASGPRRLRPGPSLPAAAGPARSGPVATPPSRSGTATPRARADPPPGPPSASTIPSAAACSSSSSSFQRYVPSGIDDQVELVVEGVVADRRPAQRLLEVDVPVLECAVGLEEEVDRVRRDPPGRGRSRRACSRSARAPTPRPGSGSARPCRRPEASPGCPAASRAQRARGSPRRSGRPAHARPGRDARRARPRLYAPLHPWPTPDLSVVVTLLNEQGSVEELYRRTVTALDGKPFELILVDDGSTDGTWAAVERPARRRPPRARGPLQAQLRPAPGHARRVSRAPGATSS